jgi:hypothetical protein
VPLLEHRGGALTTGSIASFDAASRSISSSSGRLKSWSAFATGMNAESSRSKPRNWPFFSITPITRKRVCETRTIWPSGFASPNSSRSSRGPITTTGEVRS